MSNNHIDDGGKAPSVAPSLSLSSRGLTLCLAGVVLAGLVVYSIFPESVGGPPLPVKVWLAEQPVEIPGGGAAVMAEVVMLRNEASHSISKITLDINGQYLLFRQSDLEAGKF